MAGRTLQRMWQHYARTATERYIILVTVRPWHQSLKGVCGCARQGSGSNMMAMRADKTGVLKRVRPRVTSFRQRLLRWYDENGRDFPWRRPAASRYQKVIAEILLQRTRAETVTVFCPRFVADFPSWTRLASASETELRGYLEPIGLWRRRASVLRRLSHEMALRKGRFPQRRAEIESLPGVGQYVANSILLLVHGEREPLLDGSMARVLERYFGPRELVDIRFDPYLQQLARKVVDHSRSAEVSWALLDLGAMVCRPRQPRCTECPVRRGCWFAAPQG
jgi:A/G-specific adenine glycosylase